MIDLKEFVSGSQNREWCERREVNTEVFTVSTHPVLSALPNAALRCRINKSSQNKNRRLQTGYRRGSETSPETRSDGPNLVTWC